MDSMNRTQHLRASVASHDRKLRYRALLEDLSILEDEGGTNEERMDRTSNALREAQLLLSAGGVEERVRHPGEGFLDSRVLRATSDLVVRCSEAVSGNVNTYDRHELAACIKDNPEFWELVFPREVTSASYLFGTFAPTPPEERQRKPRRRMERQEVAALKEPDNVDKMEKTQEGSEMVSRVNRYITKKYRSDGAPLSYFHLVLDPTSFSRSVENVYYVSFLVRDGMVSVDVDEETGLPLVTPIADTQREGDQRNLKDENQFIVSIDMERWQQLVEAFQISKPMMSLKRS